MDVDVYKDYTISLAYDLAQTKQNFAYSDHSDTVSRKMGFIPLPLGVVMLRVVYTSVKSTNPGAWAVVACAYLCLLTFRILGSIVILGKACDLVDEHQGKQEEKRAMEEAGTEFVETMLKFDGLVEVMRASQISEVIENALQGNTESGMQLDDEVGNAADVENNSTL